MTLTSGIMIATHNRKDVLRKTLDEISRLSPQPVEIIICADACTDGTAEYVRASHPAVRLITNETSRGSIGSRDAMMRLASTDIVLSFDDDSHPVESDFVRGSCELFEKHPQLAVASFPQYSDEFPESLQQKDFGPPYFTGFYASSSAAIRRSAYLATGGYANYSTMSMKNRILRCAALLPAGR